MDLEMGKSPRVKVIAGGGVGQRPESIAKKTLSTRRDLSPESRIPKRLKRHVLLDDLKLVADSKDEMRALDLA